jgi:3-deoxy-D-manno-octulosonate 8-phosphate phosphatase (KDO 8-P phosphatase)
VIDIDLSDLKYVAFDFDGVFTDNTVVIDESGKESVRCSRFDGIGLDRVKKSQYRDVHNLIRNKSIGLKKG